MSDEKMEESQYDPKLNEDTGPTFSLGIHGDVGMPEGETEPEYFSKPNATYDLEALQKDERRPWSMGIQGGEETEPEPLVNPGGDDE